MAQTKTLNGWDTEAVGAAIEMVKKQPEAGKLTWRNRITWDSGFGMDAKASEIEQMGKVISRNFKLRSDHPTQLLGQDTGPTAVEILLAALGCCITGTYAAQATARGISLEELEVEIEAQIDLQGFFLLAPVRPGLSNVQVKIRVKADADPKVLDEIRLATLKASPVYDSVANPVSIETSLEQIR